MTCAHSTSFGAKSPAATSRVRNCFPTEHLSRYHQMPCKHFFDHGALLVVSRDQDLWQCIPQRPVPMSELWIKLDARMALALLTSRTLLDTADRELFDRRTAWLLARRRY